MEKDTQSLIAPILLFALSLALWLIYRQRPSSHYTDHSLGRPLPPGPRPLPFIGNLLDLPSGKPWMGYRDLSRKYGGLLYMNVVGQPLIIIDDLTIATDILDKRSAKYSSRPQSRLVSLSGWEWNMAFMPYGARWRHHRRVIWQHYNPNAVARYQSAQHESARNLLFNILESPELVVDHVRYALGFTMIKATYGLNVAAINDKYITAADEATQSLELLVAGSSLLEFFPLLAKLPTWLPGTGLLSRLKEARHANAKFRDLPWEDGKQQMEATGESTSILHALVASIEKLDNEAAAVEDEVAKNVAAVAYGAGIDTTLAFMVAFFAAISHHPDIQHKARIELDKVVGADRLPTLADRPALPYVNAIMKETMRWHVPAPLILPHFATEDDEYDGYLIPQGSTILVNVWSMLHDPQRYPQPNEFIPERFLDDGKLNLSSGDPGLTAFGFGRRVCPGRHFADTTAFIYVACILHTLDVSLPVDAEGKPLDVPIKVSTGIVANIENCRCTIRPRSAVREGLIREAYTGGIAYPGPPP